MGLQFTPGSQLQPQAQPQAAQEVVLAKTPEDAALDVKIEEAKNYNIVVETDKIKQELASSADIDRIVSTINLNDSNTIVKFGAEAAEEISKASDQVLNSMTIDQVNDAGIMLKELGKIMERFDINEIKDDKPGFFGNLKKKLEKIIGKYETMGNDVDKIYIELKKYEKEIGDANNKLDNMYEAGLLPGACQVHHGRRAGGQGAGPVHRGLHREVRGGAGQRHDPHGSLQSDADARDSRPESNGPEGG